MINFLKLRWALRRRRDDPLLGPAFLKALRGAPWDQVRNPRDMKLARKLAHRGFSLYDEETAQYVPGPNYDWTTWALYEIQERRYSKEADMLINRMLLHKQERTAVNHTIRTMSDASLAYLQTVVKASPFLDINGALEVRRLTLRSAYLKYRRKKQERKAQTRMVMSRIRK